MDNNYKLYKLIFNNIVLNKIIFKFVKNHDNRYNKIHYKYSTAGLQFITNTNNFELFIDKSKIGWKFDQIKIQVVSTYLLASFLSGFKDYMADRMELFQLIMIKFYNENKKYLISLKIDLIELLVSSNNVELLEYHLSQSPNKPLHKLNTSGLYEIALMYGHLEMVIYLNENLKIDYTKERGYTENALYWSIKSNNRNKIVNYLINQMGHIPPIKDNMYHNDFFSYFIQLDYKILKSIISNGADFKYQADILFATRIIDVISNLSLNDLINFIKSSIYVNIHLGTINKETKVLLKLINQLIKFNKITNKEEQDQFIKQYKSNFNGIVKTMAIKRYSTDTEDTNNNSIFSKFKNLLSSSKQPTETSFFKSLLVTNFNDFNLTREIKRIHLYFLLRNEYMVGSHTIATLIIEFASCFGEYNLILELDQFNYRLMDRNTIICTCQKVATSNADSKLVVYTFDNFSKDSDLFFSYNFNNDYGALDIRKFQLYNCETVSIDNQIHYVSILMLYNINYPVSYSEVLKHIFTNNKTTLSIDNLDKITNLIEKSYQLQLDKGCSFSKKLQASILIDNQFAADYYLNKHPHKKDLFHNWNGYYNQ